MEDAWREKRQALKKTMENVLEYKCPHCGGKLNFDSSAQAMKCPYCDSVIEVEALKEFDESLSSFSKEDEMEWQKPGKVWQEGDTEGLRVYACKACGGEIIGDENLGATNCPYCGNPVVLMGQFAGDLKPEYIIPFKLDKKAAKEAYLKHLKGKKLLPNLFKDNNHIDEIKGLYVPFWIFDAKAEGEARYEGTRIRTWQDSKNRYTETQYFDIQRAGNVKFDKVPVDGSEAMPNDLMESIEPFDYTEAVDFQTAYLSGFLADRYDVSAEDTIARANERIKQTLFDDLASSATGYSTVTLKDGFVNLTDAVSHYAMFPVWLLNTTYKKEKYLFCMNGQTGKMVGNLPVDKGKIWKYRLMWTGIVAAIIFGLLLLLFFLRG